MNRRIIHLLTGLLFVVAEVAFGQNTNSARPNIVIIYADDLGFGDMSAYGNLYGTPSPAPTPHMDALASEGLMFTQAHSSNASCTPSRYALLTGKYNWRTFSGIGNSYGRPEIPSSDTTLAEFLKTQGYHTAAFGKWHLGGYFYDRSGVPYTGRDNTITDAASVDWEHPLVGHATDNGFDIFRGLAVTINLTPYVYVKENRIQYYDAGLGAYRDALNTDTYHSFTKAELADGLTVGTSGEAGLGDPSYKQIDADPIMIAEVENYMAGRATNTAPFFTYVCLYSPHLPWHITPPFTNAVGFAYGNWMADVDNRIGRILSAIATNGLWTNTVVILTGDNGPETIAFTNSRTNGRDSNGPLRGIKRDAWEGGTRVPFVVRWPGQVAAPGTVSNELIWQGDIFATIAAYLGADLPANVAPDGESFLNILRGQSKPTRRRDSIVMESYLNHRAVVFTDGWKLVDSTAGGGNGTSYDSANNNITSAIGTNRGTPKQLFYLPGDLGEDTNQIAGITDVSEIRSNLVLQTGRDLLARLDQYRTDLTSSIFTPFPDNDLDGMPNWFENQHAGLNRENLFDAAMDFDSDGLTNLQEFQNGTDPNNPDTDGDRLTDGYEVNTLHSQPGNADTDGDGLADGDEVLVYDTNPLLADTDGDGVNDGDEVGAMASPLNPGNTPATNPPVQTALSPTLVQLAGVNGTTNDPAVQGATGWAEAGTLYVRERPEGGTSQEYRTQLFLQFDLTTLYGRLEGARLRVHQRHKLNSNSGTSNASDLEVARVTSSWGTSAGNYPVFNQTPVSNAFRFGNNQDFGSAATSQGFYSGAPGVAGTDDSGFDPSGQVTEFVRSWLTGLNTNYGIRIRMTDRSYAGVAFSDADNGGTAGDERLQLLVMLHQSPNSLDTDNDGLPDAWELSHAVNLTVLNGSGDEDGDGFSNASELAAGSDGWNRASVPVLQSQLVGTQCEFRFRRYRNGNYGYELDVSTDLKTWSSALGVLTKTSVVIDDADYETVAYRLVDAGAPRLFVRLRIHQPSTP